MAVAQSRASIRDRIILSTPFSSWKIFVARISDGGRSQSSLSYAAGHAALKWLNETAQNGRPT
jgi:hypothetical protein